MSDEIKVSEKDNKLVQYPLQDKYCITGEGRKYYMAPITEQLAIGIGQMSDIATLTICDKTINKRDVYALIKNAKDTSNIPPKVQADIKRLFDEKNMNSMPGRYNFNTREGSLKMTICREYMVHYRYGLSCIGNPEHIIIFKY